MAQPVLGLPVQPPVNPPAVAPSGIDLVGRAVAPIQANQNDPSWKVVVVHKRLTSSDGQVFIEPRYTFDPAIVDAQGRMIPQIARDANGQPIPKEYKYVVDRHTGKLYWSDDKFLVAVKCAVIFVANIFYSPARMAWYLVISPIANITIIAAQTIREFGQRYREGQNAAAAKALLKGFVWEIPKAVVLSLFDAVKTPFYAIGIAFTSGMGVISMDPYRWRKYEAMVENSMCHGANYLEDFREVSEQPRAQGFWGMLDAYQRTKAFYLGWCFQDRGELNARQDLVFVREEACEGISREHLANFPCPSIIPARCLPQAAPAA